VPARKPLECSGSFTLLSFNLICGSTEEMPPNIEGLSIPRIHGFVLVEILRASSSDTLRMTNLFFVGILTTIRKNEGLGFIELTAKGRRAQKPSTPAPSLGCD
jgi:hypothetical protein